MTRTLVLLAVIAVSGIGAATAAEAPDANDVIAVRKAGQDLVLGDFTGMLQAAKNKVPDVKPFAKPAFAIAGWERVFLTMFPPGSDHGENTKALPAIWSNRAGFEKAGQKLASEAGKLGDFAKSGDQAGFASQVHVVGDACTACHKQFRAH
ncbi:MAG: cytochrome c [Pseudomonadota bacterium]|nr:cytochrome c [Pseudomonadota bacterium]